MDVWADGRTNGWMVKRMDRVGVLVVWVNGWLDGWAS